MRKAAWTLILFVFIASASPAGADNRDIADPIDTRGRLDIRLIQHGHWNDDEGNDFYVHTIRTYDKWRTRLLKGEYTELSFWFSTDRDDRKERVVYVNYRRGGLSASMNTYEEDGDSASVSFIGDVRVRRINRRSVRVWLPVEWMSDTQIDGYGWYAMSFFTAENGSHCRRAYGCADRAPNAGFVRHRL